MRTKEKVISQFTRWATKNYKSIRYRCIGMMVLTVFNIFIFLYLPLIQQQRYDELWHVKSFIWPYYLFYIVSGVWILIFLIARYLVKKEENRS